jgi:hypothetical protein
MNNIMTRALTQVDNPLNPHNLFGHATNTRVRWHFSLLGATL